LAVDFFLATCIPAMDDLANVDTMALNKGWVVRAFRLTESKYSQCDQAGEPMILLF
jgi:hypothetical protein